MISYQLYVTLTIYLDIKFFSRRHRLASKKAQLAVSNEGEKAMFQIHLKDKPQLLHHPCILSLTQERQCHLLHKPTLLHHQPSRRRQSTIQSPHHSLTQRHRLLRQLQAVPQPRPRVLLQLICLGRCRRSPRIHLRLSLLPRLHKQTNELQTTIASLAHIHHHQCPL